MTATQAVLTRPQPSHAVYPVWRHRYGAFRWSDGRMASQERTGVGALIRQARKTSGLTLPAVAARLDVSANCLGHWEREFRHPNTRQLCELAAALDVSPRSLMPDPAPVMPALFTGAITCPCCGTDSAVVMSAVAPPVPVRKSLPTERNRS